MRNSLWPCGSTVFKQQYSCAFATISWMQGLYWTHKFTLSSKQEYTLHNYPNQASSLSDCFHYWFLLVLIWDHMFCWTCVCVFFFWSQTTYLPRIVFICRFWSLIVTSARSALPVIRSICEFCVSISSPSPRPRFFSRSKPSDIAPKHKPENNTVNAWHSYHNPKMYSNTIYQWFLFDKQRCVCIYYKI